MVSFLQVSPPDFCMYFPSPPYVPHALPILSSVEWWRRPRRIQILIKIFVYCDWVKSAFHLFFTFISFIYPSIYFSFISVTVSSLYCRKATVQDKAFPVQAWTCSQDSRRFRLPRFLDSRHTKVVRLSALLTDRLRPSGKGPWYSFLLQAESTPWS